MTQCHFCDQRIELAVPGWVAVGAAGSVYVAHVGCYRKYGPPRTPLSMAAQNARRPLPVEYLAGGDSGDSQ